MREAWAGDPSAAPKGAGCRSLLEDAADQRGHVFASLLCRASWCRPKMSHRRRWGRSSAPSSHSLTPHSSVCPHPSIPNPGMHQLESSPYASLTSLSAAFRVEKSVMRCIAAAAAPRKY